MNDIKDINITPFKYCVVFTTFNDYDLALKIKNNLFMKKLAIDVSIVESEYYYLPNREFNDPESYMLIIKTKISLLDQLKKEILIMHEHDSSDFIAIPVIDINIHLEDYIEKHLKRD